MTTPERLRSSKEAPITKTGQRLEGVPDFGCYVAGRWLTTENAIEVHSPFDESLVATVHLAGPGEYEKAISAATSAFEITRKLPTWKRTEILEKISQGIAQRHEEFARMIALEAGKPIRTARAEVDRAVFTFKVAAEETRRIYGEIVPLDWIPGNENREAHIYRVPLGPVAGITPFNFPINLVAHKVAPALAAGDPIIIRPASQTPVSALMLAEIIHDSGWPLEAFSVLPSRVSDASILVKDNRIQLLTFTGSPAVGWGLKTQAGRKRVTLELGGNAGVIVHNDADLEYAAKRIAWGGFSYAGQSCISVQRVYIHEAIYEKFSEMLVAKVKALLTGNPLEESTDVGPVIDSGAAKRIEEWVSEAVGAGAKVLTGGTHQGNLWQPTVMSNLQPEYKVTCQEVFAPLVGLYPYSDVSQAIQAVDESDFGLQAGLFTKDISIIHQAIEDLEVGGLMINDVPTYRVDHMPYGGVKLSGFGREGLRYAIEEMSEMKLVTYNAGV